MEEFNGIDFIRNFFISDYRIFGSEEKCKKNLKNKNIYLKV